MADGRGGNRRRRAAGLAAAIELRARGVGEVVVIEREAEVGGIPRHAATRALGARPAPPAERAAYARRYAGLARVAGVDVLTETMATGWVTAPSS